MSFFNVFKRRSQTDSKPGVEEGSASTADANFFDTDHAYDDVAERWQTKRLSGEHDKQSTREKKPEITDKPKKKDTKRLSGELENHSTNENKYGIQEDPKKPQLPEHIPITGSEYGNFPMKKYESEYENVETVSRNMQPEQLNRHKPKRSCRPHANKSDDTEHITENMFTQVDTVSVDKPALPERASGDRHTKWQNTGVTKRHKTGPEQEQIQNEAARSKSDLTHKTNMALGLCLPLMYIDQQHAANLTFLEKNAKAYPAQAIIVYTFASEDHRNAEIATRIIKHLEKNASAESSENYVYPQRSAEDEAGIYFWHQVFNLKDFMSKVVCLTRRGTSIGKIKELRALGAAMILSDILVYEVYQRITSDDIELFRDAIKYVSGKTGKALPEKKLFISVKNWMDKEKHNYGLHGGKAYIINTLVSANMSQEMVNGRAEILLTFGVPDCILLPSRDEPLLGENYRQCLKEEEDCLLKRLNESPEGSISLSELKEKTELLSRETFS